LPVRVDWFACPVIPSCCPVIVAERSLIRRGKRVVLQDRNGGDFRQKITVTIRTTQAGECTGALDRPVENTRQPFGVPHDPRGRQC
jgi:hypothetical protein